MKGRQLFRSASLLTGTSMVFLSGVVWAQATRGVIVGRVSDPATALVQEAKVTLSNENTGITAAATTGTQGDYAFTNVEPGVYKVTVAAPGFKTAVVRNVNVFVDQTVRVDVKLDLGDVATRGRRSSHVAGGAVGDLFNWQRRRWQANQCPAVERTGRAFSV